MDLHNKITVDLLNNNTMCKLHLTTYLNIIRKTYYNI